MIKTLLLTHYVSTFSSARPLRKLSVLWWRSSKYLPNLGGAECHCSKQLKRDGGPARLKESHELQLPRLSFAATFLFDVLKHLWASTRLRLRYQPDIQIYHTAAATMEIFITLQNNYDWTTKEPTCCGEAVSVFGSDHRIPVWRRTVRKRISTLTTPKSRICHVWRQSGGRLWALSR